MELSISKNKSGKTEVGVRKIMLLKMGLKDKEEEIKITSKILLQLKF